MKFKQIFYCNTFTKRAYCTIYKEKIYMTTKSKKTVENLEKTLNKSSLVDSAEQLELLIERAKKAQRFLQHLLKNKLMQSSKQLQLPLTKLVFL